MISIDERAARGTEAQVRTPLSEHAAWTPAAGRSSPVDLLVEQETTREPDLIPVRHGRMMVSPFTFYRGAAKIMAEDLKNTPTAGLDAQLCGDAHLSNFGAFASPERRLLFDLNDFDETLPGPFEYDVKRMAVSFVLAARDNGFTRAEAQAAAQASVAGYREAMADFAQRKMMDIWYASLDESEIMRVARIATEAAEKAEKTDEKAVKKTAKKVTKDKTASKAGAKRKDMAAEKAEKTDEKEARRQADMARLAEKRVQKFSAKARTRDSLSALSKLAEVVDGRYRIVSQPPVVIPLRELTPELSPAQLDHMIRDQFRRYRATLQPDRKRLLEQFEIVDVARKVVGVGSVGTRGFIALLQGRDAADPLFLQAKEATASVLEAHLPRSKYRNHGQRVVQGQRLMQAASDIFLGWTTGVDVNRHFYWRQLRDMKGSVPVEVMTPLGLAMYGRLCGWTLARAHARSGDSVAMAAYLGQTDEFDRAISAFSERYADQNERDYDEFITAIKDGRLTCTEGV
jgi:uncharacterized protein (DUF2252 family)